MGPEKLADRFLGRGFQALQFGELRRLLERSPQPEACKAKRPADDERDAPPVRRRLRRRQHAADHQCDGRTQRDAQRHKSEHHAADKRRHPWCRFDHVRDGTRQFSTETKPLRQAKQDDDDAGCNPPGRVGRHDADAERGRGSNKDRREENAASSELVAESAEHETTNWPREVPDGEGRKGDHERDERILAGKYGASDLRREDAEDDEVVVLECPAEAGEQNHPPRAAAHRVCHAAKNWWGPAEGGPH
jgi:hypothetical protein